MTMKQFTIDESFLVSVTERREWSIYEGIPSEQLTDYQLLKILKGADKCSTSSFADHPEFATLREQLGSSGYIAIDRAGWNGDRVKMKFLLNGYLFKPGESFPCASAMALKFKVFRKQNAMAEEQ